jgi:ATP-dependent Lon protease
MGGSTPKDGPSAGAAIALALASLMTGRPMRRDVAVTGEIDTQGRITAVGGLDVKLETAASAGCKTVIIPRENLRGPGGIERFPVALRRELQILSFSEWSGEHPPHDPSRHVLEVVAVDHIVEAWQVAALFTEPIEALLASLGASARALRDRLRGEPAPREHDVLVVVAKSVDELEEESLDGAHDGHPVDRFVLVPPESERSAAKRLPELDASAHILTFDPGEQELRTELARAIERGADAGRARDLWLVGPYFLLRQAIADGSHPVGRLCANNYCVQGFKLKHSKALLNRSYSVLAGLGPEAMSHCPLLAVREGVVVVDLSVIPERLRLDVARAELLLHQCFQAWLGALTAPT